MTAKHSPATSLPWKLKQDKAAPYSGIYTETGKQITHENGATSDENAAYIVHAANQYGELVKALQFYAQGGGQEAIDALKAAGEL